jgi:hypothetical protein
MVESKSKTLGLALTFLLILLPQFAFSATEEWGTKLRSSFIWVRAGVATNGTLHAGFRRGFELESAPAQARLHLFAYTRYQLFVNGEYVGRGPNRFENRRPEYDTWDLAAQLRPGPNVIAVLVHRDWPGENLRSTGQTLSRFRMHAPGFTALLELADGGRKTVIATDEKWRAFVETGFAQIQGTVQGTRREVVLSSGPHSGKL